MAAFTSWINSFWKNLNGFLILPRISRILREFCCHVLLWQNSEREMMKIKAFYSILLLANLWINLGITIIWLILVKIQNFKLKIKFHPGINITATFTVHLRLLFTTYLINIYVLGNKILMRTLCKMFDKFLSSAMYLCKNQPTIFRKIIHTKSISI